MDRLAQNALVAGLRFDRAALDACIREGGGGPLVEGWRLDGVAASALARFEHAALKEGRAADVVQAASIHALNLCGRREDRETALKIARRASRMSRTEAVPEQEYLANLVLARVRRYNGRPYLATRILTSLLGFVPEPWHRWVGWELSMAGGGLPRGGKAGEPAHALHLAMKHVSDGDRDGWVSVMSSLVEHAWPLVSRDATGLMSVMDPLAQTQDEHVERWRRGVVSMPPDGLLAVASGARVGSVAHVYRDGVNEPRRLLSTGVPLVRSAGVLELAPTPRRSSRVDTLLAVLSLATTELAVEDVFHRVWGFAFSKTLHGEAFNISLHRARSRIGDAGRIERQQEKLRLDMSCPLLVPDPRCSPPADERVLQYVASHRKVNARDAATALDMSLRSVQDALKILVEAGACQRMRDGRTVLYEVEDTTFREPSTLQLI